MLPKSLANLREWRKSACPHLLRSASITNTLKDGSNKMIPYVPIAGRRECLLIFGHSGENIEYVLAELLRVWHDTLLRIQESIYYDPRHNNQIMKEKERRRV